MPRRQARRSRGNRNVARNIVTSRVAPQPGRTNAPQSIVEVGSIALDTVGTVGNVSKDAHMWAMSYSNLASTRLGLMFTLYERMRPIKLTAEYVPTSGSSTVGNVTAYWETDISDSVPASGVTSADYLQNALQMQGAMMIPLANIGAERRARMVHYPASNLGRRSRWYYTAPVGMDNREVVPGYLSWAVGGHDGDPTGYWLLHYEVEFKTPQAPGSFPSHDASTINKLLSSADTPTGSQMLDDVADNVTGFVFAEDDLTPVEVPIGKIVTGRYNGSSNVSLKRSNGTELAHGAPVEVHPAKTVWDEDQNTMNPVVGTTSWIGGLFDGLTKQPLIWSVAVAAGKALLSSVSIVSK